MILRSTVIARSLREDPARSDSVPGSAQTTLLLYFAACSFSTGDRWPGSIATRDEQ